MGRMQARVMYSAQADQAVVRRIADELPSILQRVLTANLQEAVERNTLSLELDHQPNDGVLSHLYRIVLDLPNLYNTPSQGEGERELSRQQIVTICLSLAEELQKALPALVSAKELEVNARIFLWECSV